MYPNTTSAHSNHVSARAAVEQTAQGHIGLPILSAQEIPGEDAVGLDSNGACKPAGLTKISSSVQVIGHVPYAAKSKSNVYTWRVLVRII
jgi:hypothetical protein